MGKLTNALAIFSEAPPSPLPAPAAPVEAAAPVDRRPRQEILTPFAPQTSLSTIVWADIFGDNLPLTRAVAMSVPALAKARHTVCPKIAGTPLRLLRWDAATATDSELPQAGWMVRTDDGVSPWHRMLWTIDDLGHTGWSLWKVTSRLANRFPQYMSRVPRDAWSFDSDGYVVDADSKRIEPAEDLVLIPGPHEGILNYGRTAILHARQLMRAAARAGDVPNPNVTLTYTGDEQLTDDEIRELIQWYVDARNGANGGVAYKTSNLDADYGPSIDAQLLIDGRNAAAVDMARLWGIAAAMVDATTPKSTLTYETTQGRGLEHTEYGVDPYMEAVAARLSMDDICPQGQRVRFDITQDTGPVQPTGPAVED